jgi:hypothetical protein
MDRVILTRVLSAFLFTSTFIIAAPVRADVETPASAPATQRAERRGVPRRAMAGRHGTQAFARTELFFGTAKPDGAVTDAQFRAFVDREVTPRFPDGLTLRKADGQFMGPDGVTIKEDAYVLILLYPISSQKQHNESIETIRRLYMSQYEQESVLRVDDSLLVWVSF